MTAAMSANTVSMMGVMFMVISFQIS